ncbi:MAG: hypothetical protein ACREBZ_05620 [Thermoplasmata archaeon]
MTTAHTAGSEYPTQGNVLTAGTVTTFIGFLVIVISAILIDALSPSVGALQTQQMLDGAYVGFVIIVVGIVLVFVGRSRRPAPRR